MSKLKNNVKIIKALADEGRMRIVFLLYLKKGLCVCEIKEMIGLSQPTISSHLRQLESAGVVESEKDGLWVNYRLSDDMDRDIKDMINILYTRAKEDGKVKDDMDKIKDINRHRLCKREG